MKVRDDRDGNFLDAHSYICLFSPFFRSWFLSVVWYSVVCVWWGCVVEQV